ncbi:SUN domain-containing ossification factor-like [Thalassophryne amazonica]|uniref:SUN domain-containing ossification factor-like n=1 Tax=Thalassophryne amazonica TaxID=390379 RepID=UPI0014708CDE|nr:SUN domain-containing ossification factor-like [Thalassophryne amazonica]
MCPQVSDGQNYLMLSLMLCVFLGLLLCANHCRFSVAHSATAPHDHPMTKSSRFCCPERQLCSCDDGGLKRSASYPLLNSFQVAATEDIGWTGWKSLHRPVSDSSHFRAVGNSPSPQNRLLLPGDCSYYVLGPEQSIRGYSRQQRLSILTFLTISPRPKLHK